ncbi:DUF6084 family protein [Hoyosella subflava]|uniref:Uncharacterized protein n=1 Tax=Hoyosella subflava (strain DSM 45089 / JCM 17490 / NBRC 109087 / DQS3-9A1) TaxID=443218 RepID=F6ENF4_HOYSD|nr:DUF6084 family protein [Hoyosella subflava]AEF40425.1 hypothetical protein AS9A_1976 [Hoyosella subflava DQS3-9A1]
MTALQFEVLSIEPEQFAVTPNLLVTLRITEQSAAQVHAIVLNCQIRIEPQRRRYSDDEAAGLRDLFGPREQWASAVRAFQWLHTATTVPGFVGSYDATLPIPCTYDFEVTAAKYLHALDRAENDENGSQGKVPLVFLFSGSVFTKSGAGIHVERVPWHCEASYDMPVKVWHDLIAQHYPNSGWLRLDTDTMNALLRFKAAKGLTTLDAAVSLLLLHERDAGEVPK